MSTIIDFAEKLRAQIDIVDLVGGYVQLRRGGVNMKGLCPFHREKTPSFTVSPSKQIFHCFGCNEGGDIIKFVQKIERLEWIEAVRHLADRYHIEMPELRRGENDAQEKDARERLLAVSKIAVEHFTARLRQIAADDSTELAGYLKRRGLDDETVNRFQLGVAADAWQDFIDAARKRSYEPETVVAAGLAIRNTESGRTYDRFRKRLIFPICDPQGRPIAFGGRVYASDASPEEPKYVNSPETMLYHKGRHLYALHLAKDAMVREKRALLMEGYMDVIRAHQHGFTNAVATCGTALTEEQAAVLKKYCNEIVFVYDGDEAGQKAMLRGCEVLLEHDYTIRVVVLPEEHDPDSFLQKEGAQALTAMVDSAQNYFAFFLNCATAKFPRNTPEGKVAIVEFLLPLLRRIRNAIARNEYVRRAADFLDIDPALIARQVSESNPHNLERLRRAVEEQAAEQATPLERMLLRLYVESPGVRHKLAALISNDWLRHPLVRKWLTFCCTPTGECAISWPDLFTMAEGDDEEKFLRELALCEEPLDEQDRTLEHLAARMQVNYQKQQNLLLAQQMHEFYQNSRMHDTALSRDLDTQAQYIKTAGRGYFITRPARRD